MTSQLQANGLPALDAAGEAHHAALVAHLIAQIHARDGWLSFADFMHIALYTPHLGYYSGQANKFGADGDFVTAPELTPVFAQTLAVQAAQVLSHVGGGVLELGAGTGKLALGLLSQLDTLGQLPTQYAILEVSADLRDRQQNYLKSQLPTALFDRLVWLDQLPDQWQGVILGNEVLDAIPVHRLQWQAGQWHEIGLVLTPHPHDAEMPLQWASRSLTDTQLLNQSMLDAVAKQPLPDGYETEVCPAANALIASLAERLQAGLMLWIDYGFSSSTYYHPQRIEGTLMCHFQQRSHSNPLLNLGLQDITAHVDFTAIAEAALAHGLQCAGYTSQAQFLINCGVLSHLALLSPEQVTSYLPAVAAVQKLLSPAEMGELFKVMALTKHMTIDLIGFSQGDKRHQL